MNMFRFLMAPAFIAGMALPAAAEKISLPVLSAYLNGIKTAEGTFTQINDDGSKSAGRIYIKRPGKIRFEYDPPEQTLVIADGTSVAIVDAKSNQRPEAYPIFRTPLSVILARRVNLGRARMVTGHSSDGTYTTVRAQDPKHTEYGSIDLVFTDNPVRLSRWIINDGNGGRTTVVLGDLVKGGQFDKELFILPKGTVVHKDR
jgi:outer membrane lipoprotein-sorting protein